VATGDKSSYHKRRSPTASVVTAAPVPVIQRHSRVMQTPGEGEAVSTTFNNKDAAPRGEIVMRVLQPESGEHHHSPQARESHPGAVIRSGGATLRSNDPMNPSGDTIKVSHIRFKNGLPVHGPPTSIALTSIYNEEKINKFRLNN
jgi:hypothetical protein